MKLELNSQVPSWTRLNYLEYCASSLIDCPSQTMKVVFQSNRALLKETPAMAARPIANQPKGSTISTMSLVTISKESICQRVISTWIALKDRYFPRICNLSLRRKMEWLSQPLEDNRSQVLRLNLTRQSLQRLRCSTNKHSWDLPVVASATFLAPTSQRAKVRILYVTQSLRTCNTNNRLEIQVLRLERLPKNIITRPRPTCLQTFRQSSGHMKAPLSA